jgi:hypothetical protein
MAVTHRLRRTLQARAPATSERLSERGFLLAGATAGALGWGVTQLLAWAALPAGPLLVTAWWTVLVAGFGLLTVLHGPAAVRFSDAMFVWGTVNGTAMVVTVGGVLGLVPPRVAFWGAWAAASTIGYAGTGVLLLRADHRERGVGYLLSGAIALCVLTVGLGSFDRVVSAGPLVFGILHVVPLAVDATSPAVRRPGALR